MIRSITPLILFVTILVACVAPKTEIPTQDVIVPSQTSFQPQVEILSFGDGGLISSKPCKAPCFFGIIPGETSKDSAISLLEKHGFHQCIQVSQDDIACMERVLISFNPSTNTVDGIGYIPDTIVSVEDVISKYGDPDSVQVISSGIPEAPATTVILLFDKVNTRIRLPEVIEVNYFVKGSTKADLITYLDSARYSEQKDNKFSQPWKGYSTYEP